MNIFDRITEAVIAGRDDEIVKLADEVIANGIDPVDAIQNGGVRG
ncbi:MAG: dimethylamine corrinoid protein 3, partial [Clostridia bacterium]|nr:dimethylamine corrinoid protein 3 [Clostridia bacterium]